MNFWTPLPTNQEHHFVQQPKSCMMMTTTFQRSQKTVSTKYYFQSDRLNRLIDKILDLEKFETGKQPF
jgi:hypothetical protein